VSRWPSGRAAKPAEPVTPEEAFAYLDAHANYDTTGRIDSPTLARIAQIVGAMGDPQSTYPVIHVTGTNGKGSTTAMITHLLMAHGLTVGTYTSPHLERLNERITRNGEPIEDDEFAEQIAAVADIEGLIGVRPSYFEAMTAAAFRWFADVAVDVAVVEVGLLGRWDATNVCTAQVAVITNIGIDHTEFAGPSKLDIANEKAGIIKPTSAVIVGETDPELVEVFTAVEAFFAAPVAEELVIEGFAGVTMPGRFEVLGHQPLVIVDGAHNPMGADSCAQVFFDDFDPAGSKILVVGFLRGRDAREMLSALRADEFDVVFTCTAPSPRGMPAAELTTAAKALGCDNVVECTTVEQACDRAVRLAESDDAVLVTGSLYTVGAARPFLRKLL